MKRFSCKRCGEKFLYQSQLSRHEKRNHKQTSADAASSLTVAASGEGEIFCLFFHYYRNVM